MRPEIMLIGLLYFVRKPIIFCVFVVEIIENANKGTPIPIPKNKKLMIPEKKVDRVVIRVKRAAMNKGLHGTTIAPKKNP